MRQRDDPQRREDKGHAGLPFCLPPDPVMDEIRKRNRQIADEVQIAHSWRIVPGARGGVNDRCRTLTSLSSASHLEETRRRSSGARSKRAVAAGSGMITPPAAVADGNVNAKFEAR